MARRRTLSAGRTSRPAGVGRIAAGRCSRSAPPAARSRAASTSATTCRTSAGSAPASSRSWAISSAASSSVGDRVAAVCSRHAVERTEQSRAKPDIHGLSRRPGCLSPGRARCRATMPPVRLRQATRAQPAAAIRAASAGLVGPGPDRLGEVDVGVGVAATPRGRPPAAPASGTRCRRCGTARHVGVAELADHQPAAGPGHPGHLAQRRVGVGDVAQPEGDGHRVEGGVGERQPQRVAGEQRQRRARPACRPAACRGRSRAADRVRAGLRRTPRWRRRCRRARSSTRSPGRSVERRAGSARRQRRSCPSESTCW